MTKFTKILSLAIAGLGLAAASNVASANSIDPQTGDIGLKIVSQGTPNVYSVDMMITGGNSVVTNDQFAIFDVETSSSVNPVAGITLPTGWAASVVATVPYVTFPTTDNPTLYDVVFTYTGPTIKTTGSDVNLGVFKFTSPISFGAGAVVDGSAVYNNTPDGTGSNIGNGIIWTVSGGSGATPTPLPAGFTSGIVGLVLAGGLGAAKLRKSVAC